MNITLVIKEILRYRAKDNRIAIFIDLKSAYNTIDREILYEIIMEKQILQASEIEFLRKLHALVYFKYRGGKVHFKNGVHQGS